MASAITALDSSARAAMIREIDAAVRVYVDDSGLAVPVECNVVTARSVVNPMEGHGGCCVTSS
jgi:hypothetical protein